MTWVLIRKKHVLAPKQGSLQGAGIKTIPPTIMEVEFTTSFISIYIYMYIVFQGGHAIHFDCCSGSICCPFWCVSVPTSIEETPGTPCPNYDGRRCATPHSIRCLRNMDIMRNRNTGEKNKQHKHLYNRSSFNRKDQLATPTSARSARRHIDQGGVVVASHLYLGAGPAGMS